MNDDTLTSEQFAKLRDTWFETYGDAMAVGLAVVPGWTQFLNQPGAWCDSSRTQYVIDWDPADPNTLNPSLRIVTPGGYTKWFGNITPQHLTAAALLAFKMTTLKEERQAAERAASVEVALADLNQAFAKCRELGVEIMHASGLDTIIGPCDANAVKAAPGLMSTKQTPRVAIHLDYKSPLELRTSDGKILKAAE
jgi:hypothetical protein